MWDYISSKPAKVSRLAPIRTLECATSSPDDDTLLTHGDRYFVLTSGPMRPERTLTRAVPLFVSTISSCGARRCQVVGSSSWKIPCAVCTCFTGLVLICLMARVARSSCQGEFESLPLLKLKAMNPHIELPSLSVVVGTSNVRVVTLFPTR
jgi:hypothetical protein